MFDFCGIGAARRWVRPLPADGGGRRLLQVGRLEDQTHLGAHLDDLAAHQAELQEDAQSVIKRREKNANALSISIAN